MFRGSTPICLDSWKGIVDIIGGASRGRMRRWRCGKLGKRPKWEDVNGLREGNPSRSHKDGIRMTGSGVFGPRIDPKMLKSMTPAELERKLYGQVDILNLRRHEMHTHPSLSELASRPIFQLHCVFMIDGAKTNTDADILAWCRASCLCERAADLMLLQQASSVQFVSAHNTVSLELRGMGGASFDPAEYRSNVVRDLEETIKVLLQIGEFARPERAAQEAEMPLFSGGVVGDDCSPVLRKRNGRAVGQQRSPSPTPTPGAKARVLSSKEELDGSANSTTDDLEALHKYSVDIGATLQGVLNPGQSAMDALDELRRLSPYAVKMRHRLPPAPTDDAKPASSLLNSERRALDNANSIFKWHFFNADPRSHFADVVGHRRPLPTILLVHPTYNLGNLTNSHVHWYLKRSGFQGVLDGPQEVIKAAAKWCGSGVGRGPEGPKHSEVAPNAEHRHTATCCH